MNTITAEKMAEVKNRVRALFFAFGAAKAEASIESVTSAIIDDLERFPDLAALLDRNNTWNYYITQTAFNLAA